MVSLAWLTRKLPLLCRSPLMSIFSEPFSVIELLEIVRSPLWPVALRIVPGP
jgi:hypothetical protein